MNLSPAQDAILTSLKRCTCATAAQLAAFAGVQVPAISKAVGPLLDERFVVIEDVLRPAVYRLAWRGAVYVGATTVAAKRRPTASTLMHYCHRNAAELTLSAHISGFKFLPRSTMLRQGLRPSHGEHGAIDKNNTAYCVLLDDYLMPSYRLRRTWDRRHTPDGNYFEDSTGRRWRDIVNQYLVVTTDSRQAERHEKWAVKNEIPVLVETIPPLWPGVGVCA